MKYFKEDISSTERSARLQWTHWVVILSSLLLTFGAWYISSHQIEEKARVQFDNQSRQVVGMITERMQRYEDALWAGVAAIHSQSSGIDYIEWKRFADTLHIDTKYPGINGIGVIYYVPPEKLESFLATKHSLRPDFRIFPKHDKNEYWPITYVEPLVSNAKALGLDMAHETNRLAAAKKARDTGRAQITAPIVLVQDSKKPPGFLFYAPFYRGDSIPAGVDERRDKFIGMVYAPFITYRLMAGTLQQDNRLVNVRLRDENEVIYDELGEGGEDLDPSPLYTKTATIHMYGRPWKVDIQSALSFRALVKNNQPLVILCGGLLVDAMLLWVFILLTSSNKHAYNLANRMTKQIQEEASRVLAITNTVLDGLITIDSRGIIQTFNPAATHIFGYRVEEVVGRNINMLMPDPYHLEHDGYLSNYQTAGKQKVMGVGREVVGERKDGGQFPMDLSVNEMDLKAERLFVATVRDITERKEAERLKNEFVSTISHELRTPLTSIRGSLGLIAGAMSKDVSEKALSLINIAHQNSERLILLINDMLDIDKIASGEMRFDIKEENLAHIITQAVETNQPYAAKHDASIVAQPADADVYVQVDSARLLQVCANLLSNAVKFSNAGDNIEVSTTVSDRFARIMVKDYGQGIPEEFHTRIFGKFSQADSSSARAKDGTGLGLHISKQIILQMHGDIGFTTKQGEGTTFWIDVPLAQQHDENQDPVQEPAMLERNSKASAKSSVPVLLHVEDDPDLSNVLATALHGSAEVLAAATLKAAKEILSRVECSAIILDIRLPDGSGLDLLDDLPEHIDISKQVMILTANESAEKMQGQVASVMVKSRVSETKVIETILALVDDQHDDGAGV